MSIIDKYIAVHNTMQAYQLTSRVKNLTGDWCVRGQYAAYLQEVRIALFSPALTQILVTTNAAKMATYIDALVALEGKR